MKKVLIVKTSSMGDVIHALPLVHDAALLAPDVEIHWLVERSFADILKLSPGVARVHVCAFRQWRRNLFNGETWSQIGELKRALRAEKYDCVIDIQGLARSGLAAGWADAPAWGYRRDQIKEPIAGIFYDERFNIPAGLHAVDRYRRAAASVLYPNEALPQLAFGLKAPKVQDADLADRYACFAVNTSRDSKLWPEERWVELGIHLHRMGIQAIFFWGSTVERDRCCRIASKIPGSYVVDRKDLYTTAGYLAGSVGLVGVDTGLSHLGAALGIDSIGVFVSTPPEILRLVGEGRTVSFGGVGVVPSAAEVIAKAEEFFALRK